jgi:hypothetical protein
MVNYKEARSVFIGDQMGLAVRALLDLKKSSGTVM